MKMKLEAINIQGRCNMNLICPNCDCYIVSKRAHKKYCSGKKCQHEETINKETKDGVLYQYCPDCKEELPAEYRDSVVINGKTFFYDCTRKHEHGGSCLTTNMINELSEIVYSDDAK